MRHFSKILTALLSFVIAGPLLLAGCAEDTEETVAVSQGLEYEINDDGTATVTGKGTCEDDVIVIPSETDGHAVVCIGNSAFKNETISGVVIPDSVKVIDKMAFASCMFLTSVNLPESLEEVGINAFMTCGFHEIEIPESIIPAIKSNAFWGCYLETINGENSAAWLEKHNLNWQNVLTETDDNDPDADVEVVDTPGVT